MGWGRSSSGLQSDPWNGGWGKGGVQKSSQRTAGSCSFYFLYFYATFFFLSYFFLQFIINYLSHFRFSYIIQEYVTNEACVESPAAGSVWIWRDMMAICIFTAYTYMYIHIRI